MGNEEAGALDDLAVAAREEDRLGALAEYAELRRRWLAGERRPGDHQRRMALARLLNQTGGIPHELRWPRGR